MSAEHFFVKGAIASPGKKVLETALTLSKTVTHKLVTKLLIVQHSLLYSTCLAKKRVG